MSVNDQLILKEAGLTVVEAATRLGISRQSLARRIADPESTLSFRHLIDLAASLSSDASTTTVAADAQKLRSSLAALIQSVRARHNFDLREDLQKLENSRADFDSPRTSVGPPSVGQLLEADWAVTAFIVADGKTLWMNPMISAALRGDNHSNTADSMKYLVLSADLDLLRAAIPHDRISDGAGDGAVTLIEFPAARLLPDCLVQLDPTHQDLSLSRGVELRTGHPLGDEICSRLTEALVHIKTLVFIGQSPAFKGISARVVTSS